MRARLDRELGQASTRADALLGAVHADTKSLMNVSNCAADIAILVDLTHPSSYS